MWTVHWLSMQQRPLDFRTNITISAPFHIWVCELGCTRVHNYFSSAHSRNRIRLQSRAHSPHTKGSVHFPFRTGMRPLSSISTKKWRAVVNGLVPERQSLVIATHFKPEFCFSNALLLLSITFPLRIFFSVWRCKKRILHWSECMAPRKGGT